MLRGAFFHEGHEDDDDHGLGFHRHDMEGPADDVDDVIWGFDNVELVTVGVDVGSSTSHLLFAKLHLQRLSQSLSSRFAVVKREVLHRSPILLTPYRPDGLIDIDGLRTFFDDAYIEAGLTPEAIDTGAVILTGAALERANAQAVAELFASSGGKFVCASAGHNLEALLSAHGSGASALSHTAGKVILHMDIGGGTSKLSLLRDNEVLETCAVHVGGRLVAVDEQDRVTRIEPSAEVVAEQLGIRLALDEPLSAADRRRLAEALVEILLDTAEGKPLAEPYKEFLLTEPLSFAEAKPEALTFSGGVSEYIYNREATTYGDLALDLAQALTAARERGRLPLPALNLPEGIRATVIGASQFSVQLSGNTVHISNPAALPMRNLPVVHPRLQEPLEEDAVAAAIAQAFRRLDLQEGEQPVALALPWSGDPYYKTLRALAGGIARGFANSLKAGFPLVIALNGDVGRSIGGILEEELGVTADLVSIDGLHLVELDYVDIGEVIQPANVVPVVVKSLAFAGAAAQGAMRGHHAQHRAKPALTSA